MVSTSIGAEGLGARDKEHLLIADDPAAFSAAIERVWNDGGLRRRLGEAGGKLYREKFTWEAAWKSLDL